MRWLLADLKDDWVWDISKARNMMMDYICSVERKEESELTTQCLFEKLITVMQKPGNEGKLRV